MPSCLLALGSNLGDRETTLGSALKALEAVTSIHLLRHSKWLSSRPVGMAGSRHEFLNGAAVIETTLEPAALLEVLQSVETQYGRQPGADWADRTLDLDLLLYDDRIIETATLSVPHPRMSFRRFVLEPAAEVASDLVHPVLGWTIGQLRNHLDTGADLVAVVSPSEPARRALVATLCRRFDMRTTERPAVEQFAHLWPTDYTTWLRFSAAVTTGDLRTSTDRTEGASHPAARQPKLSILWDGKLPEPGGTGGEARWEALVWQPGRGPTLDIRLRGPHSVEREAFAAIEAVWPRLGP